MSKEENRTELDNELVVLEEVKYPVSIDEINTFLSEYKEVPKIDPEADNAGELYQIVLKGHKTAVKFRTSIEKKRKELKAPALEYGKRVDEIAKEYQAMVGTKEIELFTQRKLVEDNEQRKQDELIEKERERVANIDARINSIKDLPLRYMNNDSAYLNDVIKLMSIPTEEEFEEHIERAIAAYNTSLEQLNSLFNTKVQAENSDRIHAEQEAKRKEEEAALEAERAKEREAFEAEKREFSRQQAEQQRAFQEQQEEINRQNAEREAEETERQQKIESEQRAKLAKEEQEERQKQDIAHREAKIAETLKAMDKYTDNWLLINEIIAGAIPNIKWEV